MSGDGGGGGTKVVYIKKKGKHGGHHGGAWKVAYADFVTAMMALFIVLWLLTQTDTASRERIAQYFRTGTLPGGTMVHGQTAGSNPPLAINIFPVAPPPRPKNEQEVKTLKDLTKAVAGMVIEGEHGDKKKGKDGEVDDIAEHVNARIVDEGALIELVDGGDNFLFSVSSSALRPGAVKLLKRLAPLLAKVPNKIEIHGHTDARRFEKGAPLDNWDLSFQRANQARQVMEASGLPKNRVSAVLAHADSAPYNEKNRYASENRRLAILVVRQGYEQQRQGKVDDKVDIQQGPDGIDKLERGAPPGAALPATGHSHGDGAAHDAADTKPEQPAGHNPATKPEQPAGHNPATKAEQPGHNPSGAEPPAAAPVPAPAEAPAPAAAPAPAPKAAPAPAKRPGARSTRPKRKGSTLSARVASRIRDTATPAADGAAKAP